MDNLPSKEVIDRANELLKLEIKANNFSVDSWVYIDFVNEDRFLDSISRDAESGIDFSGLDAQDLVDYAMDNIS